MKEAAVHPFCNKRRVALSGLAMLALVTTSGCVRLGSKAPERLLTIASESAAPVGVAASSPGDSALFIEEPSVPKSLATLRVAVQDGPTSIAYVKDALWVDTPARQFRALLGETIRAGSGRLVLDPAQFPARHGSVLQGDLIIFGLDAQRNVAVVTFDATMLAPDGQTLMSQRFTASRPVRYIEADSVAPAISAAANEVAKAVAEWVGRSK